MSRRLPFQRANAGGAAPWSPALLSSLVLWAKSDAGVTQSAGLVSAWADLSGQGNHLVQASGTKQPLLTANQINGYPAIVFDGIDNSMGVAFALAQPTTIFTVLSQITWTSFDQMHDGFGVLNTLSLFQRTASAQLAINAGTQLGPTAGPALGTFALSTCIFNGASSVLQFNSLAETTGNAGAAAAAGVRLGTRGTDGGNYGNVAFAEVIVMAAVATAAERLDVKSYVLSRYGF